MSYVLFLDDVRDPPYWLGYEPIIARDLPELQLAFHIYGVPGIISFDHDLGKFQSGHLKPSGIDALHWLIERHLDGQHDLGQIDQVFVHSSNPPGAQNIKSLWDSFSSTILKNGVRANWRQADAGRAAQQYQPERQRKGPKR